MATLASCNNNDDNFEPGSPAGTKASVYFINNYDAQNIIGDEPTIQDTLWFELGRTDSTEALDVPLVVESKAECISVPETVHFDAGDTTAWLGLTYVGIKFGEEAKFTVRIADDYANPYTEKEGSTRLMSSILRSQWNTVCDSLVFSPASYAWPDQGCRVENLQGQKRFRFTNFLGSGQSLEFSLNGEFDKVDLTNNKGEINPLSNYYDMGTYWYFTNGGNYDPWSPKGSKKTIEYMYFWVGESYTMLDLGIDKDVASTVTLDGETYYYGLNQDHYGIMTAWIVYTDGTSGWEYIYLYPYYKKS